MPPESEVAALLAHRTGELSLLESDRLARFYSAIGSEKALDVLETVFKTLHHLDIGVVVAVLMNFKPPRSLAKWLDRLRRVMWSNLHYEALYGAILKRLIEEDAHAELLEVVKLGISLPTFKLVFFNFWRKDKKHIKPEYIAPFLDLLIEWKDTVSWEELTKPENLKDTQITLNTAFKFAVLTNTPSQHPLFKMLRALPSESPQLPFIIKLKCLSSRYTPDLAPALNVLSEMLEAGVEANARVYAAVIDAVSRNHTQGPAALFPVLQNAAKFNVNLQDPDILLALLRTSLAWRDLKQADSILGTLLSQKYSPAEYMSIRSQAVALVQFKRGYYTYKIIQVLVDPQNGGIDPVQKFHLLTEALEQPNNPKEYQIFYETARSMYKPALDSAWTKAKSRSNESPK